ncbi:MAG: hypothetical protein AVDCRST_MAG25-2703, partial [uncultured Rubrobacteraceae bacterium]
ERRREGPAGGRRPGGDAVDARGVAPETGRGPRRRGSGPEAGARRPQEPVLAGGGRRGRGRRVPAPRTLEPRPAARAVARRRLRRDRARVRRARPGRRPV